MDQNLIILVGRAVKDPEFVPAGRTGDPHIKFTLAVNRVVPRASGPKADYFPCTYWGQDAQKKLDMMSKGGEIAIVGRIYTDMVQGSSGRREFFWEVRIDELQPGRMSLKNLGAVGVVGDSRTDAMNQLHKEFGE